MTFLGVDVYSWIIYVGTLIVSVILSCVAKKTNKILYVCLIALLWTFIAGFRAPNVGIDSGNNAYFAEMLIANQDIGQINDRLFYAVCWVILKIFPTYTAVFVFCAIITNFLILLRLWDFHEISDFTLCIVRHYTLYFFYSMNIMRQFTAVGLIFYATRFLDNKQTTKFIITTLIATVFFHVSGIIGFAFLFFYQFEINQKLTKDSLLVRMIAIVAMFLVSIVLSGTSYSRYFAEGGGSLVIQLVFKVAIFIGMLMYGTTFKYNDKNTLLYKNSRNTYGVGLALSFISTWIKFGDRIGIYFYVFESVFWGVFVKRGKYSLFFKVGFYALIIYLFIQTMTANNQGQLPYVFCWNTH